MARRRRQQRSEHQLSGQLFLGAVVARPTGDEEAPMAAEFSLLIARVQQLLNRYHAGEIGALALAEALSNEKVIDTAGAEWTLGATSGAWYRRMPTMDWAQVPPPGPSVKPRISLTVTESGTVHDTAAPGDIFAELYAPERSEPTGDTDWVTRQPDLGDLQMVTGDLPDPPTPATPHPERDEELLHRWLDVDQT